MMTDLSTIHALELIQNLQNARSKDCLFGLLNQTQTAMGARVLKSSVLQPSTSAAYLTKRYDALEELTTREDVFFAVRQALKAFVDVDRVLTAITLIPTKPSILHSEQSINNVISLKQYVKSIPPIYEALETTRSELLVGIYELCSPANYTDVQAMIDDTINEDITYQVQPLDLRNQRTYAVKVSRCPIGFKRSLNDRASLHSQESTAFLTLQDRRTKRRTRTLTSSSQVWVKPMR